MADAVSETEPTQRPRFGSWGGWLLTVFATACYLFMYSGAVGHSPQPPVHPRAATAGWILAGLSPLAAYVSYQLLRKRYRSKRGTFLCAVVALGLFLLCQVLGITLLHHALPGQPLRLG